MDISISKQVITQAIKVRTDEVTALQASLDLLNGTYKAEFIALETAQKESNDKAIEVNAERQKVIAREATISDISALVVTAQAETSEVLKTLDEKEANIIELQKDIDDARTVIADKEATISDLTTQVETISVEKETLATQLEGAMNVKETPVELSTEELIK